MFFLSKRQLLEIVFIFIFLGFIIPNNVCASVGSNLVNNSFFPVNQDVSSELSSPVKYLILMTMLSLIPAFVIAATAFTRIIIVLSMLRVAIGLQSTPPNSVLLTLAFFLTLFTMQPVIVEIEKQAYDPLLSGEIDERTALKLASIPLKQFMLANTKESDLIVILDIAKQKVPENLKDLSLLHLTPAFMLSELRTAFQMGFVLFLPFILIDLFVASTLMGLGMIMLPPMTIALPLKVLVFVLSDGWVLLTRSLLASFSG